MKKNELIEKDQSSNALITTSGFESYLKDLGLPYEGIIASDDEREVMRSNLPLSINKIPQDLKNDARYLSKFVASSAIGLYDAALNYLWNEVIVSLREKVNVYGLDFFFDAAVGGEVRETYSNFEDLSSIKDVVLIDNCKKLELISDILHEKLKHILFMRNHIGASHPNDEAISTFELLGWLEVCVNQVIADRPSEAAVYIKHLVENLKKEDLTISDAHADQIETTLKQQNRTIAGNLLATIFGIFIKKNTSPKVRENILKLAPVIWNSSSDDKRYEIGLKVDKFSLHLDEESTSLANSFLIKCDGLTYKSEGTKARDLDILLDRLLDVHYPNDNYHHEVPVAREIKSYIKEESDILPNIEDKLIQNILECRIGNGNWYHEGVSPGAKPFYDEVISLFNSKQVNKLVKNLSGPTKRAQLQLGNCRFQIISILEIINLDLQEPRTKEAIEYIIKNLDSARNNIFKTKELQDCIMYL